MNTSTINENERKCYSISILIVTLAGVSSSEKERVFLALAGDTRLVSSVLSGVKWYESRDPSRDLLRDGSRVMLSLSDELVRSNDL